MVVERVRMNNDVPAHRLDKIKSNGGAALRAIHKDSRSIRKRIHVSANEIIGERVIGDIHSAPSGVLQHLLRERFLLRSDHKVSTSCADRRSLLAGTRLRNHGDT
ncbi:unannotated protein [freshwater metagenome]|uniref:Unannotated protein n=1 Tax=freshwater metagenome TaxID=449393 RepID=A0A6J6QK05_9ZZZZ